MEMCTLAGRAAGIVCDCGVGGGWSWVRGVDDGIDGIDGIGWGGVGWGGFRWSMEWRWVRGEVRRGEVEVEVEG